MKPFAPDGNNEISLLDLAFDWTCMERQITEQHGHTKQLAEVYRRATSSLIEPSNKVHQSCFQKKPQQHELVLILGPSGVGKTSLALTLENQVQKDSGFFCRGKFGQPNSDMTEEVAATAPENNAHGPFITAMTDWVKLVCKRERSYLEAVKKSIHIELDLTEIQVMEESIKALQRITRCRTSDDENIPKRAYWRGLKGIEADKRYMHIFSKFVKAICSPDHPIVILIENLQWAERNSLELLLMLTNTTSDISGFLLLCTLRQDQDSLIERSSLPVDIMELKKNGANITEMQMGNLSEMAVNDLMASILNLPSIDTEGLSKIVHERTSGNPFFIRQFLSGLRGDGLLYLNQEGEKWCWQEEKIILALHGPPTVTSLLVKQMMQLSEYERQILQFASCLGGTIHECLLLEAAVLCSGVRCSLETLTDQGLITFDAINGTGQFLHDQIQEAAYSLIHESKRAAMHLNIGLRLWIWLKPIHREAHLFTIANQIIHGMHLLDDPVEKEELAAFMLRVGEKAALLSSFAAAAAYFDVGISLLERKHWKSQYQLSLSLYNAAVEVQYYRGNLARVDILLEVIFKRAKSFDDKLRAHFIQIYSLGSRDDMAQALIRGLEVLKLLGESFPRNPSKFEATFALSRCRWSLRRMSDDDIMNLPTMTDKRRLVSMRLLNTILIFAWLKEELIPLLVFRMISITIRHGMSPLSK
jgi:protein kinase